MQTGSAMRWVIWGILALAALWSGYWYLAAEAKRGALEDWFAARRAEGWQAEHAAIRVRGYPYRFDTTLRGLLLTDPGTGVAWEAPTLQILALAYRPNHAIVFWPDHQVLASPRERVEVQSDEMQASIVFRPGAALELDRSTMTIAGMTLESDEGWRAALPEAQVSTRRVEGAENTHDIAFDARELALPGPLKARLDRSGLLPDAIGTLRLHMTAGFAAPIDRRVIEDRRPDITTLRIDDLTALWGRLELRAAGRVVADAQGYPEGEIMVKATNWREMLAIGVQAGLFGEGTAGVLESGLDFLARMSGHPETIDAPLTFRDGRVSFGPIGLGQVPRLRLP